MWLRSGSIPVCSPLRAAPYSPRSPQLSSPSIEDAAAASLGRPSEVSHLTSAGSGKFQKIRTPAVLRLERHKVGVPPRGDLARTHGTTHPPCAFAHVLDRHWSVLLSSHRLARGSMLFFRHRTHRRQSGYGEKGDRRAAGEFPPTDTFACEKHRPIPTRYPRRTNVTCVPPGASSNR